MKFSVITVFPEMVENFFSQGVVGQSINRNLLSLETISPRSFTEDVHRTIDDRPFGGGDGMIMMSAPLEKALLSIQDLSKSRVIYLTPHGTPFNDKKARELAQLSHLVLICGRYGGIDQRFINTHVEEELSIGDYILSGGELGAAVVIDAVARMIPGVLGHGASAHEDSFSKDLMLEQPHFTRPREWLGQFVPEVLTTGNHKAISEWKEKVSMLVTLLKRPDLFWKGSISDREIDSLKLFWKQVSNNDRAVLGLDELTEKSFERGKS